MYPTTHAILDTAAGGTFMKKGPHKAYELLVEMGSNNYKWQIERGATRRPAGVQSALVISIVREIFLIVVF